MSSHSSPNSPLHSNTENDAESLARNLFGILGIHIHEQPIPNAVTLGYLKEGESLADVVDRGPFLASFGRAALTRAIEGYDDPEKKESDKNNNPLMGSFAPAGMGKTYTIGLLMELTRCLFSRGPECIIAREYINRHLGEKWGARLADYLEDYILIPITFDERQPITDADKEPSVMVFGRILHVLLNSLAGISVSVSQCQSALKQIYPSEVISGETILAFLDFIFQGKSSSRKVKYLFAIDDLTEIEDANVRGSVLHLFMSLMDMRQSSLVYATSASDEALFDMVTVFKRTVCILPLNRCPSMILRNERLMELIGKNRAFLPVLFDLCATPRLLSTKEDMDSLEAKVTWSYGEMIKHSALNSLLKEVNYENASDVVYETLRCAPVENYRRVIKYYDLFRNGLMLPFDVNAILSPAYTLNSEHSTESVLPVLVRSLLELDSGSVRGLSCAAYLALAMCLVNPCESDCLKVFFALNELLHRARIPDGWNYRANLDDDDDDDDYPVDYKEEVTMGRVHQRLKNHPMADLPVIVHLNHKLAYANRPCIDALIGNLCSLLREGSDESNESDASSVRDRITRLNVPEYESDVLRGVEYGDFLRFGKGGMMLVNVPNGSGYDFVIGDGQCLSFYAVDVLGSCADVIDEKYNQCKVGFELVQKRVGNVFTQWRLFYMSLDDDSVSTLAHPNLYFLGPRDVSLMFPKTFLNLVELAKEPSEVVVLESFKEKMRAQCGAEINYLDTLEAELKEDADASDDD